MATVIQINANLQWRAERGVHSDRWIGFCDPLGIVTEAGSLDELHSLIPEAIHLLMIDLLEDKELDAFLRERGWTASPPVHTSTGGKEPEFHVPWFLVAGGAGDGRARQTH
jgi:hypothetical protein